MKLNKNALLLVIALMVFASSAKLLLSAIAMHDKLEHARQQRMTAQRKMNDIADVCKSVLLSIPPGNDRLQTIKSVVANAGVSLFNFAREAQLTVDTLSIKSASQGDVALDTVVETVPLTNENIKRITFLMKVNFSNLQFLQVFIKRIPETRGYLSNLDVKQGSAELTIKYLGL